MDIFSDVVAGARPHLRQAAIHAGHELGLFEALGSPRTAAALAHTLRLSPHRSLALLEALALEGVVDRLTIGPIRFHCRGAPPRPAPPPPGGWGLLAEVLRTDRPLDEPAARGEAGEGLGRYHSYLEGAGAQAAASLASALTGDRARDLVDLGAGAGTYARAWLRADPASRALLVDRAPVLALAQRALVGEGLDGRADLLPGALEDLAPAALVAPGTGGPGEGPGVPRTALLANLLHLYGPEACRRLVALAARAAGPGGRVVIKDLLLDPDHTGPACSLLFSLNMALYSEGGRVHDLDALVGFLRDGGLSEIEVRSLPGALEAVVVVGRVRS